MKSGGSICMVMLTQLLMLLTVVIVQSFHSPQTPARHSQSGGTPFLRFATTDTKTSTPDCLNVLYKAANAKLDSDLVVNALTEWEKLARTSVDAAQLRAQLCGSWRLVFTTGTAKTQETIGKINYFPLKAVQSFTADGGIENGIYVGDFSVLQFAGTYTFDERKKRVEFDFDSLTALQWITVPLKKGEAAELGAKSGLGSESNVVNAKRNKSAFFNWISADDQIATARGGGGGLALWKRVAGEQSN